MESIRGCNFIRSKLLRQCKYNAICTNRIPTSFIYISNTDESHVFIAERKGERYRINLQDSIPVSALFSKSKSDRIINARRAIKPRYPVSKERRAENWEGGGEGGKKSIIRYVNSSASRRSHIPDVRHVSIPLQFQRHSRFVFFSLLSFFSFLFSSLFFFSLPSSIFMTRSKQSSRGYENGTKLFLSFHGQPLEFNKTLSLSLSLVWRARTRDKTFVPGSALKIAIEGCSILINFHGANYHASSRRDGFF